MIHKLKYGLNIETRVYYVECSCGMSLSVQCATVSVQCATDYDFPPQAVVQTMLQDAGERHLLEAQNAET